jgi:hypothetical protein
MHGFGFWLATAGLLIAAGVFVPYGILSGGAASFDVLLFWCLFGIAVIGLIAVGVSRWRL